MKSLRLPLAFASVVSASLIACAAAEGETTSASDLTSVENTAVKEQTIGNCWLYGTAAWIESIHKAATHEEMDLSEAYWTYWYWYEQITQSEVTKFTRGYDGSRITEGAYWGIGAELVRRYGWMRETDFIPDAKLVGDRHREALNAMNTSLMSGALKDVEARKDPEIVLQELNRAWNLSEPVANEMLSVFGPKRNFLTPGLHGGSLIRHPDDLSMIANDGTTVVSLTDIVGEREPGTKYEHGIRVGKHAWSDIFYSWANDSVGKVRRDAILQNIKLNLNRRLSLPVSWSVSDAKNGVYSSVPAFAYGGHLSVLVDYEIENVPGFGTLAIDQKVTNAEALAATLLPGATIKFFRIKNSWGTSQYPGQEENKQFGKTDSTDDVGDIDGGSANDGGNLGPAKPNYLPAMPGYNDITLPYFDQDNASRGENRHFMWSVALPPQKDFPIPQAVKVQIDPDAGAVGPEGGAPVSDAGM